MFLFFPLLFLSFKTILVTKKSGQLRLYATNQCTLLFRHQMEDAGSGIQAVQKLPKQLLVTLAKAVDLQYLVNVTFNSLDINHG